MDSRLDPRHHLRSLLDLYAEYLNRFEGIFKNMSSHALAGVLPREIANGGLMGVLLWYFLDFGSLPSPLESSKGSNQEFGENLALFREFLKVTGWAQVGIGETLLAETPWRLLLEQFLAEIQATFPSKGSEIAPTKVENTPVLTPAILGSLYEAFLEQDERGRRGIFFTPPGEVDFTCKRALYSFLIDKGVADPETIHAVVYGGDIPPLGGDIIAGLMSELTTLRVLDPACGAGDFLIGMTRVIIDFLKYIARLQSRVSLESFSVNDFISHNLWGMDVKVWAKRITLARLLLCTLEMIPKDEWREVLATWTAPHIEVGDFLLILPSTRWDLVIGNPPYIRHRDISDPSANTPSKNRAYRALLQERARDRWGDQLRIKRTSDYLIYFYTAGLHALAGGGILAFVVSNAWLDVRYGFVFQEFLLNNVQLLEFFDSEHRSFTDAEINTVITIFQRPPKNVDYSRPVQFVRLEVPFDTVEIQKMQNKKDSRGLDRNGPWKVRSLTQNALLEAGREVSLMETTYYGTRWGATYFRAPDIFFELLALHPSKLAKIREIAKVERGYTTGCNEFFIVEDISPSNRDGGNGLIDIQNGLGFRGQVEPDPFFPIITSPKELTCPFWNPRDGSNRIFLCDAPRASLPPATRTYIEWGEDIEVPVKKGAAKGTTVTGVCQLASFRDKNPREWYRKRPRANKRSRIFFQKIFNTTYKIGYSAEPVFCNNTFYLIHLEKSLAAHESLLVASFLSTLTMLCIELNGRSNFGGGALDTATFDIGNVLVVDTNQVPPDVARNIGKASESLLHREFLPLEEELQAPDRRHLDALILAYLGFDGTVIDRLYAAVRTLALGRSAKSRTFAE